MIRWASGPKAPGSSDTPVGVGEAVDVAEGGQHVLVAGEGPEVELVVAVDRCLGPEPGVDRVGVLVDLVGVGAVDDGVPSSTVIRRAPASAGPRVRIIEPAAAWATNPGMSMRGHVAHARPEQRPEKVVSSTPTTVGSTPRPTARTSRWWICAADPVTEVLHVGVGAQQGLVDASTSAGLPVVRRTMVRTRRSPGRAPSRPMVGHHRREGLHPPPEHLGQQVVLGAEVVVGGGRGHPGPAGHVADGEPAVADSSTSSAVASTSCWPRLRPDARSEPPPGGLERRGSSVTVPPRVGRRRVGPPAGAAAGGTGIAHLPEGRAFGGRGGRRDSAALRVVMCLTIVWTAVQVQGPSTARASGRPGRRRGGRSASGWHHPRQARRLDGGIHVVTRTGRARRSAVRRPDGRGDRPRRHRRRGGHQRARRRPPPGGLRRAVRGHRRYRDRRRRWPAPRPTWPGRPTWWWWPWSTTTRSAPCCRGPDGGLAAAAAGHRLHRREHHLGAVRPGHRGRGRRPRRGPRRLRGQRRARRRPPPATWSAWSAATRRSSSGSARCSTPWAR